MSYILEALRKMERQRRSESEGDSWVEDLSALPEGEHTRKRNPGFIVIVASIVFGVCGLLTGVILYHGNGNPEKADSAVVKPVGGDQTLGKQVQPEPSKTVQRKTAQTQTEQLQTAQAKAKENSLPKDAKETPPAPESTPSPPQGITLSALKASLPVSSKAPGPGIEKGQGRTGEPLPPILSDDADGPEGADTEKTARKAVPGGEADTMSGMVTLKSDAPPPLTQGVSEGSSTDRVIDLTQRYRLSSTGEVENRKYATIERNDYFIGDTFMGMTVSDIQRDRVYLRGKDPSRQYVIIFRYMAR